MRLYSIYKITNTLNGHCYVGQTCRSLKERWHKHCYNARKRRQTHLHLAMHKYGIDVFTMELIEQTSDGDGKEKFWIAKLHPEYNMTDGGNTYIPSAATRKKISESKRGKSFSDEHCRRLSESLKGHVAWSKGKTFSEDHRHKMSIAKRGRTFTETHRRAMSEAQLKRRAREREASPTKTDLLEFEN